MCESKSMLPCMLVKILKKFNAHPNSTIFPFALLNSLEWKMAARLSFQV